MRSCCTRQKSKRPSSFPFAQPKAGTQRPLCRKTYNPVFVGEAREFGSHKDRRLTGFKTSSVRRASRLFPCNRASTEKKDPATDKTETSKLSSYYASLIRLPDDLSAAIDDGSRRSGRTRHFVLLTKTPVCDLQMYSDGTVQKLSSSKTTSSTIMPTEEQSHSIRKFINCPAYVYLYSACVPTVMRKATLESMILLPCWVDQDMDWNIAWDAVEEYSSHKAKAAFNRCSWNLAKLEMERFPYKKFSLEPLQDSEKQQGEGLISAEDLLTDSFLNMTTSDTEGLDSVEDAEKCRQYLSNCTSEVWNQLQWKPVIQTLKAEDLKPLEKFYMKQFCQYYEQENEESPALLSSRKMQGYEVDVSLAPWVVLLLCMPKYVANTVHYTMALKWKEAFSVGDEISISTLASTIKQWESLDFDLSKMMAYGDSLLCIMKMLSKFPTYGMVDKHSDGKRAYSQMIKETNDCPIGELLMPHSTTKNSILGALWLNSLQFSAYRMFMEGKEFIKNFSEHPFAATYAESLLLENPFSDGGYLDKVFRAFIAHYYLQHGAGALWKICQKIGLIGDDPDSGFFPDSEEWQEKDPKKSDYKKEWEENELNRKNEKLCTDKIYNGFTKRLEYTFRYEGYFHRGIYVPEIFHPFYRKYFDWCYSLGRLYMDQFFQSFMMQNYPDLSQTEIDRFINDEVKTHLYIRLAFITDLPFSGSGSHVDALFSVDQDPEMPGMHSFENVDRDELKSVKAANQQVTKSMLGMLGYIIFDGGFSIRKFNKLIEPLLAEDIKDIVANDGQIPESTSSNP